MVSRRGKRGMTLEKHRRQAGKEKRKKINNKNQQQRNVCRVGGRKSMLVVEKSLFNPFNTHNTPANQRPRVYLYWAMESNKFCFIFNIS